MDEKSARQWFGKNLREFRQSSSMTQEILSEKLNITAQHLSYLETGNRAPSFDVIVSAADVFNVSPSDLLLDSKKSLAGKNNEILSRISKLIKALTKEDQERILRIIANCVSINKTK